MTTAGVASTDVLIVGGGMVGLTLALLLNRDLPGVRVTVLEAAALPPASNQAPLAYTPSFDARNTALSRRTVQAFEQLGLWPALQARSTPIGSIHISDKGRFGMARLQAEEEQVDSFGSVIENAWLGRVLLDAVRACPSIQLISGARVNDIASATQAVRLTAQNQQGDTQQWQAALVIAADGAHSGLRQQLGLSVREQPYGQTAIVAAVETSLPHEQVAFERFTADGPLALLPLPDLPQSVLGAAPAGCRRSLVWALSTQAAEEHLALDDAAFCQALQAAFGRRAGRFLRVGQRASYPLSLIVADQQVSERVVILGNAAHSLHPVAGQGYNLCVRDALVLTRLLAEAQQDLGDPAQLARYQALRQQDQQQIIRFSDSLVRGFSSNHPLLALARNTGLVLFDVLPGAKPALARYAMGLDHV